MDYWDWYRDRLLAEREFLKLLKWRQETDIIVDRYLESLDDFKRDS